MLWFAGLLGAFVIGTVAFLDLSPAEDVDETGPDAHDFLTEHGFGNIFSARSPFEPDGLEMPEEAAPDPAPLATATAPMVDIGHTLTEFDRQTEDLIFVWDDSAGGEPDLRLGPSETDTELLELRMDDEVMARFAASSGLGLAQVALIPRSAAEALGWLPAGE